MDLLKKLSTISEADSGQEHSPGLSPQGSQLTVKSRKTVENFLSLISEEEQEIDPPSPHEGKITTTSINKISIERLSEPNQIIKIIKIEEESMEPLVNSKIIHNNNCSCTCSVF
ncbi:unnamed protein product [Blepharisma stoltei]|uniref:Uncharacterized protein n=1 Tax=Blepharisma stoltei TaxID=1481888 RepID=A0AAU9JTM0_9CILI|nr:unnamed protein product [Blepharisma stoltei]